MTTVSIIIPIYNMEQYLRQCLDSVVRQTLNKIEIICINDGSMDKSMDILKEYADIFPWIQIINQENKGVSYSRNIGIKVARGKYITFMDPDDWYPSNDSLEYLYTIGVKEKVAICGGSFSSSYYGNIRDCYENGYTLKNDKKIKFEEFQWDYGFHRFIYDRKFLIENNLFFPEYIRYEDPVFLCKALLCAGEFYGIKKITYRYRVGHQRIEWSMEKIRDLLQGILDILNLCQEHKLEILFETTKNRFITEFEKLVMCCLLDQSKNSGYHPEIHIDMVLNNSTEKIRNNSLHNIIEKGKDAELNCSLDNYRNDSVGIKINHDIKIKNHINILYKNISSLISL